MDDSASVAQNGTLTYFNSMSEGTDDFNRVGRNVHVERFKFAAIVTASSAAAPAVPYGTGFSGACRIMWVWDKSPNAVLPTVGDILETASSFVVSPLNPSNTKRFTILYDVTKPIAGGGSDTNGTLLFKGNLKINKQSQYDGTSGAIGSMLAGALYLVAGCTINGTLAGVPTISYGTDISFTDL